LLLVRHAPTAATRSGTFGLDEPIAPEARTGAADLARHFPVTGATLTSPALRCRQTAAAAGLDAVIRALAAPLHAFWRVATEPLSITELRCHDNAWTLVRSNWTAL
jgi:broad specificity phosphatase PhoE